MSRTLRTEPSRPLHRWAAGLLAAGLVLALVPASAEAQAPESHTVKTGDTLWGLAKQYLGDPFLWPEIYRLNTLVVEDPHWIYPGEVLRLAPSEQATAVPQAEAPAPQAETPAPQAGMPAPVAADTVPAEARPGIAEVPAEQPAPPANELADTARLFPPSRGRVGADLLTAGGAPPPRLLRRTEFFSSGFLTEDDHLPFGRVIGPVIPSQIPTNEPRSSTTLYSRVAVEPPAGATYQVGDSLLVANATRTLDGYGRVVEPRGMARVIQVSKGTPIVEVLAAYGEILPDQAVLPAEKFVDPGAVRPLPVSEGVEASVIGWPGRRELKGAGIVLFLDRGKRDGVAAGDVFEVRREAGRHRDGSATIADVMATVQVVHVRERTATVRVITVASPDIPRGTHAFQVAKLPS